ncbi:MAG: hypothetical protein IJQ82_10505 [Selenomonadaceae bacterium]|nr:hypothetical protein [Selenomonadaceae bacterium]
MKFKNLAALICGVMFLSSSLCFAAVDGGLISIGKIAPGMSESDLIDAFGQPINKDGDDWTYQTFKVEVERGIVEKVSTRSDTITTPNGVRVGQAADVLNSTFGKADKVDRDYNDIEYEYYSTDRTKKIEFKVINGVIAEITCKIND